MITLDRAPPTYFHTSSGSERGFAPKFTVHSVVAAATEYNHDRKDYDPGAVIVKQMAQAVVIHICFPPKMLRSFFPA
jgi:hypothetical protein